MKPSRIHEGLASIFAGGSIAMGIVGLFSHDVYAGVLCAGFALISISYRLACLSEQRLEDKK
jgi:hypothetical protein